MLAEDVEDDRRAVDDLDLDDILERTPLTRRELGVGDHGVGPERGDHALKFVRLALAEERARVGVGAALQQAVQHDCTGRLGESGELAQRVLGLVEGALPVDSDEHDVLEAQLPVLDLGDIGKLGGESADPTEGVALLAVELIAVAGASVVGGILERERTRSEEGIAFRPGVGGGQHSVDRIHGIVVSCFRFSHWVNPSLPDFGKFFSMADEHYFSQAPASALQLRPIRVTLVGTFYELTTANGVFSPERIDTGTQVLLANTPPPPPGGQFLDLGCGWGPIALSLALESPRATVWAVDVNERALDLVRRNAQTLGLDNVNACRPEDVPDGLEFMTIRSNPPIRVGKNELHNMLELWLPRLESGSDAWLVVQRNLGSDSLQRWLDGTLSRDFAVSRAATSKGYRVLRVRRR